ncbi:MAG: hypothetical protein U0271_36500 [Polyangiaceae bacterium]
MSEPERACPSCASALPTQCFACPACMLALREEGGRLVPLYPPIRPSAALYAVDLRNPAVLPMGLDLAKVAETNVVRFARAPEGLNVQVLAGKAFEWAMPFMRLTDACVSLRVPAAGGAARITLIARSSKIGTYRKYYGFMVSVTRRQACFIRMLAGSLGQKSTFTELTPWGGHDALAALNPSSVLEMRAQGPMLEGLVDGRRVAVTHDPVLGMGHLGLRIEAESSGPAHATIGGLEIAGVMA